MHTYAEVTKDISRATQILAEGRVVAFPTGTSYGLAVDALQGHALQRLRNLKGRSDDKTFTVFLHPSIWDTYVELTEDEQQILKKYQNQPLTLLVKPKLSLEHLAQDGLVGLRVIDHPVMEQLAKAANVPLTATSANIAGQSACYDTECILTAFPGLLNPEDTRHGDIAAAGKTTYDLSLGAILDGGMLPQKKPTTIVKIVDGKAIIVREGSLQLD